MSYNTTLKTARIAAGLSQPDVARNMGVTVQTVFKWEKGIAPVARDRWDRLASLLRLNQTEFEAALVQTLLDACIADGNARMLENARVSRLYNADLIASAFARFEGRAKYNPPQEDTTAELKARVEVLELQNKLLRLEKENAELKRELERRHPAKPISSSSMIEVN